MLTGTGYTSGLRKRDRLLVHHHLTLHPQLVLPQLRTGRRSMNFRCCEGEMAVVIVFRMLAQSMLSQSGGM